MPSMSPVGAGARAGAVRPEGRRRAMMKRTILALVVAVAAAGAGAGAALVSAHHHDRTTSPGPSTSSTAPGAASAAAPQILRFTSKDSSSKYVDAKPSGLSAGDVLTQHSVWYQHGAN